MKKVTKRVIILLVAVVGILSFCALTACESQGDLPSSEGLEFTLNDDGESYSVSGIGTCADQIIIIPTTYDSKPVTSIGSDAFRDCNKLISVYIPNSIVSIGESAFHHCYKLVEVINASSINITIGQPADLIFKDSSGKEWLNGKAHIKNAYVSGDAQNGGYLVVLEFTDKGVSKFADATTAIKDFSDNKLYIYLGDELVSSPTVSETINSKQATITGYDDYEDALNVATAINNGRIDYGYVGHYALKVKTSGVSDIVNKNGYLFYTYNNENYLLGYVGNDTDLTLPDNYNGEDYEIYKYAFYNCDSLTSVTIGNGVSDIGDKAFSGCSALNEIIFNGTVDDWKTIAKVSDWNSGSPAKKVICSDGTADL